MLLLAGSVAMNAPLPKLVLASRSPRRRELLAEAGYTFEVVPPDKSVEDGVPPGLSPEETVAELARRKAADVARRLFGDSGLVLGCDTVVECDGAILGKPVDRADARAMLRAIRGRVHRVASGLCLWPLGPGEPIVRIAVTTLRMDLLADEQIEEYLAGGAWVGKAGAFGYQDRTGWVHIVEGSESNVVGLPMELLAAMLGQLMPRFVILEHRDCRGTHWDLMLEREGALSTWALAEPPERPGPIAAEALPEHRMAYLDYEGPISGGRGAVRVWDRGEYTPQHETEDQWVVVLEGRRVRGTATLARSPQDPRQWQFVLDAE